MDAQDVCDGLMPKHFLKRTYDCKTNQLLTLKDCLHGKYGDLLNTLGVSEYDKESTSIKVDQDSFTYFTDQKLKIKLTINYKVK